ncbi:integrase zinc binding domain-containing protein, partial [Bacteroides uniformis]|uniref:integrase zinc binding domain-containing protein n=1 Tax=Bacteroides uniformis TaxID=820 RepID=UPI001AA17DAE
VLDGQITGNRYWVIDEVIYYRDMIFLTGNSQLKEKILRASHDSLLSGHQGFTKTYKAIRRGSLGEASKKTY